MEITRSTWDSGGSRGKSKRGSYKHLTEEKQDTIFAN